MVKRFLLDLTDYFQIVNPSPDGFRGQGSSNRFILSYQCSLSNLQHSFISKWTQFAQPRLLLPNAIPPGSQSRICFHLTDQLGVAKIESTSWRFCCFPKCFLSLWIQPSCQAANEETKQSALWFMFCVLNETLNVGGTQIHTLSEWSPSVPSVNCVCSLSTPQAWFLSRANHVCNLCCLAF